MMLDAGTGYIVIYGIMEQLLKGMLLQLEIINGLVNSIPNQQSLLFNGDSTHYVQNIILMKLIMKLQLSMAI